MEILLITVVAVFAAAAFLAWILNSAGGKANENKSIYKQANRHKYPKHK